MWQPELAFGGHWRVSGLTSAVTLNLRAGLGLHQVLNICSHRLCSQQSSEGGISVTEKLMRTSERSGHFTRSTQPTPGGSSFHTGSQDSHAPLCSLCHRTGHKTRASRASPPPMPQAAVPVPLPASASLQLPFGTSLSVCDSFFSVSFKGAHDFSLDQIQKYSIYRNRKNSIKKTFMVHIKLYLLPTT